MLDSALNIFDRTWQTQRTARNSQRSYISEVKSLINLIFTCDHLGGIELLLKTQRSSLRMMFDTCLQIFMETSVLECEDKELFI